MGDERVASPSWLLYEALVEDAAPISPRVRVDTGAPADTAEASAEAAPRSLPAALLGAWFIVAGLNLAVMLVQAVAGTRFPAYLFAFGHLLALGLVSAGVTLAFRRWVSARALWGFVALGACALALAFGILGPDFSNFVDKQAEAGSKVPWEFIAPAAIAGITLAGAVVAWFLAPRPILRLMLLPLGIALAVAGQLDLLGDYPGLRLFAQWNAANLLAAPLLGVRLPLPSGAPWSWHAVLAGYALLAVTTVLWPPQPSVLRALLRAPGSALAPHLVRLRPALSGATEASKFASGEWFAPRDKVAPIPASKPSVLPKDPIVIFITIDAVRGDLFIGDKYRKRLPNLFALRDSGVSFQTARSPSPSTLVSVTSMFTGKYYSQVYWSRAKERNTPEKDTTTRLAEHLSASGVHTLFIVNAHGTADRGGSRGFEKVVWQKKSFGPAKVAMDLMLKELKSDNSGSRFVYSHLVEPHYPYNRGGKHGSPWENWLAEVAIVDKQLGRLRKFLEKEGLQERAVIIISADHGEAFGEHGEYKHAFANYEEFVRVPFIFYIPGVEPRLIEDPVSVMDVRPTLLDLFGLDTPGTDMGQSLVPYFRGQNPKLTRPLVVDAGRRIQAMIFPDNIKVIRNLRTRVVEIYDLNKDPGEQNDLLEDPNFDAKPYENALAKFFEVHTRTDHEVPWQKF